MNGSENRKSTTLFILAVFAATFIFSGLSSTQGSLLSYMIDSFHLEASLQGFPAAALNAGCIAALVLSLFIVPRFRKPRLMWISATAMSLCAVPLALANSSLVFIIMMFVMGVAMGLLDTIDSSSVSDCYTGSKAASVMCAVHGTFGAAGIFFPLLFSAIAENGRWQAGYLVMFGICALVLCYVIPVAEKRAKTLPRPAGNASHFHFSDIRRYLSDRRSICLMLMMLAFSLFFGGFSVWCKRYMEQIAPDSAFTSLVLPMVWGAIAVTRILSAIFVKNTLRCLRAAPFLAGAFLIAAVLIGQGWSAILIMFSAAFASMIVPMGLALAGQYYRQDTSLATTMMFFMVYLGQTLGSPLIGAIAGFSSIRAGMLTIGIISALGSVPVALMKPEK